MGLRKLEEAQDFLDDEFSTLDDESGGIFSRNMKSTGCREVSGLEPGKKMKP